MSRRKKDKVASHGRVLAYKTAMPGTDLSHPWISCRKDRFECRLLFECAASLHPERPWMCPPWLLLKSQNDVLYPCEQNKYDQAIRDARGTILYLVHSGRKGRRKVRDLARRGL